MDRVLAMPELLSMIFQFLDQGSNAANARVNKQWSDLALDVLWKEVHDLHRLFGLLAPLDSAAEATEGMHVRAAIPRSNIHLPCNIYRNSRARSNQTTGVDSNAIDDASGAYRTRKQTLLSWIEACSTTSRGPVQPWTYFPVCTA